MSAPHFPSVRPPLLLRREVQTRVRAQARSGCGWDRAALRPLGRGEIRSRHPLSGLSFPGARSRGAPRPPGSARWPLPLLCGGSEWGSSKRQVLRADASPDASVGIKSKQRRRICSQLTGGRPRPRAHAGRRPLPPSWQRSSRQVEGKGAGGADSPAPAVQMPGRRRCRSIGRAERRPWAQRRPAQVRTDEGRAEDESTGI